MMWNGKNIKDILQKGYNDLRLRMAAAGAFALVWWGILYPELCFTKNTCEQVMMVEGQETVIEQTDYQEVLEAAGDEIIVKSRLLEWLSRYSSE